jgi:hypothetical protein
MAEKKSVGKIDKKFTAMKAAEGDGNYEGGLFSPTDDQLAKINQFTRSEKSANDVVCFSTLSCNDILDRDLDRFTTECVQDFAKLPGNLSPIGKSFMIGHDYEKLPVGRIFDATTKKIDGSTFLSNDVYLPNTPANKDYIDNVDYGVYWAVSVGVMLGDSSCAVCSKEFSGYGHWCVDGHEKGLSYDPNSTETDDWGWPEPVSPSQKGAVLCSRNLFAPSDFYELSQVFLGAQYYAELEKGATFGSIIKAASKRPIVNLAAKEAKELPLPEVNEKLSQARRDKHEVITQSDGTQTWTDSAKMVWVFDPEESEVLCLGTSNESEETEDGEQLRESDGSGSEQGEGTGTDNGTTPGDVEPDGEQHSDGEGTTGSVIGEGEQVSQLGAVPLTEKGEKVKMSKSLILAAANKAKVPSEVLGTALDKETSEDVLEALFVGTTSHIKSLETKVESLQERAGFGDSYLKGLKDEALVWYVKNRQAGQDKGVKTDKFEKMLKRIGDDPELLLEVIEEQKESAQAKFPSSVRRSVEINDPNERQELDPIDFDDDHSKRVRSIHG